MFVIKLTLEYDGTSYHGWQRQPRLPTIQGAVEKALSQLTGKSIPLHGAGRTDAGVHALGQVASFQSEVTFQPEVWVRALNALLPRDIAILAAEAVEPTFHARFSAKTKTYSYFIHNSRRPSPLRRQSAWHLFHPLDLHKMKAAAKELVGRHDFTSLCAASSEAEDHQVDLQTIKIEEKEDQIKITFEAARFLQYMVRNIVGLLVEIGRGRRQTEEIPTLLKGKDRRMAGPTAPPQGLFLVRIEY